jgi:tetratricopeptide (TPR) repeat protein
MRASAVVSSVLVLLLAAPAAAQRGTEDESADLVREGRGLLERKRYDDAAEALDQAIALNPRRIEAYVLRAAIHAARRDYKAGVRLLRRAQALAPANLDVLAALGAQLYLGGETDDGAALLERVVAREPERYEAQGLLGRYHVGRERWPEAIVAIEAYLTRRPAALASADPVHQARLAEAFLRAGRARDARDLYAVVLKARPKEVAARLGRAWALAAIDCNEAMRALSELEDLVEAHPEILLVRGRCALALGDATRALELGEAYVARKRGGAAGQALVGEAAAAIGDLPRAIEALRSAREL